MTRPTPAAATVRTVREAQDAAQAVREAQETLAERTARRDRAILAAAESGATYPALAEATGLTRDRVSQVLAAQRKARQTA